MKRQNPNSNEHPSAISLFDENVRSLVPDEPIAGAPDAAPPLTPIQALQERVLANAKVAAEQEAAGIGHWAAKPAVEVAPVEDTAVVPSDHAVTLARARLSQMRAGAREPEVRENAWADLGGGNYTYQEHGTVDPDRLAPIQEIRGYGWNPATRRREMGTDVIQGGRHKFVPDIRSSGGDQSSQYDIERAKEDLRAGGGRPIKKKSK